MLHWQIRRSSSRCAGALRRGLFARRKNYRLSVNIAAPLAWASGRFRPYPTRSRKRAVCVRRRDPEAPPIALLTRSMRRDDPACASHDRFGPAARPRRALFRLFFFLLLLALALVLFLRG